MNNTETLPMIVANENPSGEIGDVIAAQKRRLYLSVKAEFDAAINRYQVSALKLEDARHRLEQIDLQWWAHYGESQTQLEKHLFSLTRAERILASRKADPKVSRSDAEDRVDSELASEATALAGHRMTAMEAQLGLADFEGGVPADPEYLVREQMLRENAVFELRNYHPDKLASLLRNTDFPDDAKRRIQEFVQDCLSMKTASLCHVYPDGTLGAYEKPYSELALRKNALREFFQGQGLNTESTFYCPRRCSISLESQVAEMRAEIPIIHKDVARIQGEYELLWRDNQQQFLAQKADLRCDHEKVNREILANAEKARDEAVIAERKVDAVFKGWQW